MTVKANSLFSDRRYMTIDGFVCDLATDLRKKYALMEVENKHLKQMLEVKDKMIDIFKDGEVRRNQDLLNNIREVQSLKSRLEAQERAHSS